MNKTLIYFAVGLLIVGCALKNAPMVSKTQDREDETRLALFALDAEANKQHGAASEYYWLLYEKTKSDEYRNRYFSMMLLDGKFKEVEAGVGIMQKNGFDPQLERYRIRSLVGQLRLEDAKTSAVALVERTKTKKDYLLTSELYAQMKHFDTALKYLQGAYAIDFDAKVLDRIAVIMYVNLDKKKEAIAELETHSRLHGCDMMICKRLAGFYSDQNDANGVLNVYLRLYDNYSEDAVAEAIIRIYSYQKDILHLQRFLEDHQVNDELLLRLYVNTKKYAKAAALAQALYEKEGDPAYLGQSAIFTFEAAEKKEDPQLINRVVDQLKRAVRSHKDPLLLNYLGYLLIDNDVDPKNGIVYVKAALKEEPESPFYLDSLAWGYYKLGECDRAYVLMQRVLKTIEDKNDKAVLHHVESIEACLKEKRK